MIRHINGTQHLPRMLAFRVDGTGTASILEGAFDAVLTDNGVGDYTLTFALPFVRIPACAGSAVGTAAAIVNIGTISVNAVQILVKDAAGVAADADFHLHVLGWDSLDQVSSS